MKAVQDEDGVRVFVGEVGVIRRMEHIWAGGWFDDDYGRDDPSGSMYGRRNYGGTCYLSGTADLSPGEYLSGPRDSGSVSKEA